jgi:sortase A
MFLAVIGLVLFGQGIWIFAKAVLAQILLERAFAETIATGKTVKPWPWADTWPVARIAVPRLGQSAIALAGSSGQALAFGPGHVERTPVAGERGTAVYSAHRETHFAFLSRVDIGDEIRVTRRDGVEVSFRVTWTSVVRWDASGIDPLAPGQNLVLATCWPLDGKTSGPLRYLVHAVLADAGDLSAVGARDGTLAPVVDQPIDLGATHPDVFQLVVAERLHLGDRVSPKPPVGSATPPGAAGASHADGQSPGMPAGRGRDLP